MKKMLYASKSAIFSVLSVVAALLIGAIIILFSGENPLQVYKYMIIEPLGSVNNILNIFYVMTPLIMTGLAFVLASKGGVINLGLEGQMLLGSLVAAYIGTLFPALPKVIYIIVIMIGAMISGVLWALLPAFLKIRFGASEIVTTIMLNYIVQFFINFIIGGGIFKHESIGQRTPYILPNAHMKSLADMGTEAGNITFRGVQLNMMFPIALCFVFVVFILLEKTSWGYKVGAVGQNLRAANANGINYRRIMYSAMAASGAVAGIAAMGEVLGTFNGVVEGFSPAYGFSGISVALLGRENPVGVIFGALFFGIMNQGMMYINANTSVPKDFVKVLQTLIIIFIILSDFFESKWSNMEEKNRQAKEK
jgi:ABC-type uncharacterized transport system, permease component